MWGSDAKGWGRGLASWALVGAMVWGVAPVAQAARLALVIGNNNYQVLRPLKNATQDARDTAAELRAVGFRVPDKWLVLNATQRQMDAALQDFVANLRPDDEVVFFYAGHGVEIDAQAALVPVDLSDPARHPLDGRLRPMAEIEQAKKQVLDQSITLNRVAQDIAQRQVKFSLLVVDACRDNPVLELLREAHRNNPGRNAGPAPAVGLIADAAADTQVLLFSASKGQQALDHLGPQDRERNGLFTRVLLKALRTPGLGLRDMLPQVKAEVKQLAAQVRVEGRPHQQEPRSMAAYDAPNFFFRPPTAAAPLPATPTPATAGGVNLEDLQREEQTRQQWAQWQARMKAEYERVAAFTGSADLVVKAWERFLSTWAQNNPLSTEDETLRSQAQSQLARARQAASVAVSPPPAPAAVVVSTPQPPAAQTMDGRYQILANGAEVKDLQTGLVWQRCSVGQRWDGSSCAGTAKEFRFDEAQAQAGNGWRVPTVRELHSLIQCSKGFKGTEDLKDGKGSVPDTCVDGSNRPTLNTTAFPKTPDSWYWTSSPVVGHSGYAWYVSFGNGLVNYYGFRYYYDHVRLVR